MIAAPFHATELMPMPYATTSDKVRLYYEEVGQGTPILFVHEFASDHRGWEPQLREFGKRHRCIAYSARGYAPSDVPADANAYSYQHVMRDAVAVLDHLKIDAAHFIGLSMGGYTSLQVALKHPKRVHSLVLAGTGTGSERWYTQDLPIRASSPTCSTAKARRNGAEPGAVPHQGSARLRRVHRAPGREHDAKGSAMTSPAFSA
jgi:3-oxoadipate enol-lactonase